jgi:hypothetical protein
VQRATTRHATRDARPLATARQRQHPVVLVARREARTTGPGPVATTWHGRTIGRRVHCSFTPAPSFAFSSCLHRRLLDWSELQTVRWAARSPAHSGLTTQLNELYTNQWAEWHMQEGAHVTACEGGQGAGEGGYGSRRRCGSMTEASSVRRSCAHSAHPSICRAIPLVAAAAAAAAADTAASKRAMICRPCARHVHRRPRLPVGSTRRLRHGPGARVGLPAVRGADSVRRRWDAAAT